MVHTAVWAQEQGQGFSLPFPVGFQALGLLETARNSGNIFLLPALEWVMAHRDRKKRSLAQGGVMLWFGLLAKMPWQNETSALPYTHPEPWMVFWEYIYAPHRETSTGPPKTGGFKNVLEWVVLPSHSSYKILCHAIQG